jgi:hypothetical protein
MPAPKIKCSAKTALGHFCSAYAMHQSDPPLCSAHAGLTGAPKGNTNAVTHGYYQSIVTPQEISSLFTSAEDVALTQEVALIRVVLNRLAAYLASEELPPDKITSIAPLIFSGTRALAFVQKHLPDPNAVDWDAVLDELAEDLDWDI